MQRHVRFAVLLQIAEHGRADRATTAAMVPGASEQDVTVALENLLDEGSIEEETGRTESLVELAEGGRMRLTVLGRLRLDEDDV
jgi:molybdenum-dependent DNA-binding transcriptional regulator ModE